jgi:hypothetical protein
MKLKIKPEELPKRIHVLKRCQISVLLLLVCLTALPTNSYAADANSNRKINLSLKNEILSHLFLVKNLDSPPSHL